MRIIDADKIDFRNDAMHDSTGHLVVADNFINGILWLNDCIDNTPTIQLEPEWILASERLPETGQDVELCCGFKNYRGDFVRYICIAYHVNQYEMRSNEDWDEGCDEYREEDDEYYVLEGWYERIHNWDDYGAVKIYDLALMWRPLPELPEFHTEIKKEKIE